MDDKSAAAPATPPARWFVRGDLDGFFGLALDNLVQFLLIDNLCRHVLGFPPELIYGRILPGAAVSLLVGNVFYSWQARRLADATGRSDVCAIPYGINTVSLIAYVFLVMLPAKAKALEANVPEEQAVLIAWQAGLIAAVGCGLIELIGAFVADRVRRSTPRAALLSTLAGIALGFISLGFLFRTFATPLIGLTTLGIILLTYFGRVRFKGGLPGGLIAVGLGAGLAWLTGVAPGSGTPQGITFEPPIPVIGDLWQAVVAGHFVEYLSVILPMGLFNLVGSLQNIESAEAAGDSFPMRSSLIVNGLGSIAAGMFGSCFPTTIYIGHPGWKALGARAGYSVLNGLFFTVVCLTGSLAVIAWAVPIEAGMAIVLWIGIVMTAQAFQVTPREHAPAVVIGLLPGVAAWGTLMAKTALRAVGYGTKAGLTFNEKLIDAFQKQDTFIQGAFALEEGFIFTAMILSAATVAVIERRFIQAAGWCFLGAGLSAAGLMHSYRFTPGDAVSSLTPAWPWAAGYAAMGACFLLGRWVTTPTEEGH